MVVRIEAIRKPGANFAKTMDKEFFGKANQLIACCDFKSFEVFGKGWAYATDFFYRHA